jgi:hypothetical protein
MSDRPMVLIQDELEAINNNTRQQQQANNNSPEFDQNFDMNDSQKYLLDLSED